MMKLIFFFKLDRTKKYMEKDIEEDKAFFQDRKNLLYDQIHFFCDKITKYSYEESEMNQYIRDKYINPKNERNRNILDVIIKLTDTIVLHRFGVSYSLFDKNQKDKLLNSDLSYESIKNLSYEVTENNIEDCKKELPDKVHEML